MLLLDFFINQMQLTTTALLAAALLVASTSARPQQTIVVTTPAAAPSSPTTTNRFSELDDDDDDDPATEEEAAPADPNAKPVISQFLVRSDVQFRYARTLLQSYVKNPASVAQKVTFSLVMPDKAFVSNFSMLIGEQEFVAEVKEKEEAKETFDSAVDDGRGAGLVEQDARDANLITVSTNVEPGSKVRFSLTYEELLSRKLGRYEHIIHVNPGQVVDNFKVDVYINESLPVERVRVPKLKTNPNAITSQDPNPLAKIMKNEQDPSKMHIQFVASRADQKELSAQGVNGQFIVQYDVDGQGEDGDIQLLDGYFVHFYSPDNLPKLPKHVVFVLDVSGSMAGTKLDQTKDAMVTVLDDMTDQDYFNIITFSDNVYHWAPQSEKNKEGPHSLAFPGTEEMRDEALTYSLQLQTIGGTNINDGIVAALELIKAVRQTEELPANVRPIVIFLTDGEATTGVTDGEKILANVGSANEDLDVPIYSLAFGHGADFGLIKKLSLANNAFARRIYEGSDAAIQLEDFYAQIANPLLADVEFDYVGEHVKNSSIIKKNFGTFNRGNEFVVAGKIGEASEELDGVVDIVIKGNGINGRFQRNFTICLRPFPIPHPDVPMALPSEEEGSTVTDSDIKPLPFNPTSDPAVTENILPTSHHDLPPPLPPRFPDHCILLPPPRPREPRSEHENFIERLWAFLSIKEYLDEKKTETQERREELSDNFTTAAPTTTSEDPTAAAVVELLVDDDEEREEGVEEQEKEKVVVASPPKEKTNREKAVDLALQYNFVTPVTSLVVTRPEENTTETVEPRPVELEDQPWPRSGGGGVFLRSSLYRPLSRTRTPPGPAPYSKMRYSGTGGVRFYPQSLNSRPPTTTTYRPRTTAPVHHHGFMAMDYDYEAEDDDYGYYSLAEAAPAAAPTPPPKTNCSGSITLFSKTYRRGDKVEIDRDEEDLSNLDFDNVLKSLEVEGDCCWKVYADPGFSGSSMLFTSGQYDSPSKLPSLVKKASSVQRLVQC